MSARLFLYLDEYRVYSLSSQMFAGITESIVQESGHTGESREEQSGPLMSGRLVADIATTVTRTQERRFLRDYAYSLFETHLEQTNRVLSIDGSRPSPSRDDLNAARFVKVTGTAAFNDNEAVSALIKGFNRFGKALKYVTTHGDRETMRQLETDLAARRKSKDAAGEASVRALLDAVRSRVAGSPELKQDAQYLEELTFLLEYAQQDSFEIEISPSGTPWRVLADLKLDLLREPRQTIIRRYSRRTQVPFSVFGVVCRVGAPPSVPTPDAPVERLRDAMRGMISALTQIEESWVGLGDNEVVIDPIAIYRDV